MIKINLNSERLTFKYQLTSITYAVIKSLEWFFTISLQGSQNDRQTAVVSAIKHSWKGYKNFAWGHDELKPISETFFDSFGLGLTIVDAIDTLYITGMMEEYQEAKEWIEKSMITDPNFNVSLFETTIRVVGGLMSIYHLTGEKVFLTKATEVTYYMQSCFHSLSGIPLPIINLETSKTYGGHSGDIISTAEAATLQLEFRAVARASETPIFEARTDWINQKIHTLHKENGLAPILLNCKLKILMFETISSR